MRWLQRRAISKVLSGWWVDRLTFRYYESSDLDDPYVTLGLDLDDGMNVHSEHYYKSMTVPLATDWKGDPSKVHKWVIVATEWWLLALMAKHVSMQQMERQA